MEETKSKCGWCITGHHQSPHHLQASCGCTHPAHAS